MRAIGLTEYAKRNLHWEYAKEIQEKLPCDCDYSGFRSPSDGSELILLEFDTDRSDAIHQDFLIIE